jgi:hypothetical protein
VSIESYDINGLVIKEQRGYAQERKNIDGEDMIFVMEGGDTGIGYWYQKDKVKLLHGGWKNKTNKVISKKSFWRRAK